MDDETIRELSFKAQGAEFITTKDDDTKADTAELVLYDNRDDPRGVHRFSPSLIICVVKNGSSGYRIIYLVQSGKNTKEESVLEQDYRLESILAECLLPERFLSAVPVFEDLASLSNTLKTLATTDGPDRIDEPDYDGKVRIHVLLSPKSGTGLAPAFYSQVLKPLFNFLSLKEGIDFDAHETVDPRDAFGESVDGRTNFARDILLHDASAGRKSLVLLLSGDGGIFDLLNGPLGRGLALSARKSTYRAPSVCLFPLGTGNALFASLQRPYKIKTPSATTDLLVNAIRTVLCGTPRPLPTFVASFSSGAKIVSGDKKDPRPVDFPPPLPDSKEDANRCIFGAVVASYGFHATLVAESDLPEYRKHGIARFGMVAARLLDEENGGPHSYQCQISTSSQTTPDDDNDNKLSHHSRAPIISEGHRNGFAYILLTLVSNLEPQFVVSPASEPVDGKMRAVIIPHQSSKKFVELMGGVYAGGKHVEDESVFYDELRFVRVRTDESDVAWRRVCIDGTIVELEEGGEVCVRLSEEVGSVGVGDGILEVMVPRVSGIGYRGLDRIQMDSEGPENSNDL